MKKLKLWIKSLIIFSFTTFLICCQKEDAGLIEHSIEFEMNFLDGNSGSVLKSTDENDMKKAAKIIVTITTTSGWYIGITSAEFDIQKLNNSYLSEKIMLKKGCYKLTEFMIADSSGNIIYAAPASETVMGSAVSNPLPMAFCIDENESKKIPVEVINTNNKVPEDFGIASFYMISPTIIQFPVAIVDYETGEFLAATIEVTNVDWDSYVSTFQKPIDEGNEVYKRIVNTQATASNLLVLDDTYPTYSFKVTKDGYTGFTFTYSNDSLRRYSLPENKKTLKIEIASTFIDIISDIDGNVYNILKIGSQVWMQENLHTSLYNDGTAPDLYEVDWEYDNHDFPDPISGVEAFYSQSVILNSLNICPEGWHIPTLNDWNILIEFLGGYNVAGGKLKGGNEWELDEGQFVLGNYYCAEYKLDNLSNFTARPYNLNYFAGETGITDGGYRTSFWALSPDGTTTYRVALSNTSYGVTVSIGHADCLRCIKD